MKQKVRVRVRTVLQTPPRVPSILLSNVHLPKEGGREGQVQSFVVAIGTDPVEFRVVGVISDDD